MSKQVTITAQPALLADGKTPNPKAGQVFTLAVDKAGQPKLDKNGEKYGYIRVELKKLNLAFGYNKAVITRSTLINMTEKAYNAAKDMMTAGTKEDGQIIWKDSLTPAYVGHLPLEVPEKDATGKTIEGKMRIITSGGQPVYREEEFTSNQEANDSLLVYDKITAPVAIVIPAEQAKKETVIAGN